MSASQQKRNGPSYTEGIATVRASSSVSGAGAGLCVTAESEPIVPSSFSSSLLQNHRMEHMRAVFGELLSYDTARQ